MKPKPFLRFSSKAIALFEKVVAHYHLLDTVEQPLNNPYKPNSIEALLYEKNWIDTIQWHYEDLIRDPNIEPLDALQLKRKIDTSNQARTDIVEALDDYFLAQFSSIPKQKMATHNTESPAWAIDRLSILVLKIYHMQQEMIRPIASKAHKEACAAKNEILLAQQKDLGQAIDQLLDDLATGKKYMKVYKQMKMYNDETLNPVLYQQQKRDPS